MPPTDEIQMDVFGNEVTVSMVEPRNSKRVVDIEHEDGQKWAFSRISFSSANVIFRVFSVIFQTLDLVSQNR